jgi:hypothetical protein
MPAATTALSRTDWNSLVIRMMNIVDLLQWPAMLVTVSASWYVASTKKRRRKLGFWLFLLSNVLWVAWGLHAHAYALILLQAFLVAMNLRGLFKAEPGANAGS